MGLGTQDDLGQANDFVDRFGITFPMTWDSSSVTWRELGVASQPQAVLVAADGSELARYRGSLDEGDILSKI